MCAHTYTLIATERALTINNNIYIYIYTHTHTLKRGTEDVLERERAFLQGREVMYVYAHTHTHTLQQRGLSRSTTLAVSVSSFK